MTSRLRGWLRVARFTARHPYLTLVTIWLASLERTREAEAEDE